MRVHVRVYTHAHRCACMHTHMHMCTRTHVCTHFMHILHTHTAFSDVVFLAYDSKCLKIHMYAKLFMVIFFLKDCTPVFVNLLNFKIKRLYVLGYNSNSILIVIEIV